MKRRNHTLHITAITVLMLTTVTVATPPAKDTKRPEPSAAYLTAVDSADVCIGAGRWGDAERYLLEALRAEPANPANMLLFSNLGVTRRSLGDIDGSILAFDAGLARSPRSTVLLANRATTLLLARRDDEALADLNLALSIDSLLVNPRLMRASLYMTRNDITRAKADFNFIVRKDSTNSEALEGMASCLMQENDIDAALEYIGKARRQHDSEQLAYRHVIALIAADRPQKARSLALEAIHDFPECAELYLALSYANRLLHLNEESESALDVALRMNVDNGLVRRFYPDLKRK